MSDDISRLVICATRNQTLNTWTTDSGVTYLHSIPGKPEPHAAVPVMGKPRYGGTCDFCTEDASTHLIPARDFAVALVGNTEHWSRGAWSACTPCLLLIEANKWRKLLDRSDGGHRRLTGKWIDPAAKLYIGRIHQAFRVNIVGAAIPLPQEGEARTDE